MPFRDAWLLAGGILVFAGFAASQPAIAGVGVAIVLIGAVSRFWARRLFDRVTLRRELGERRAFIDEAVPLEVTLENRKALPLPWYEWRIAFSDPLSVEQEGLASFAVPGLSWLVRRGALGWYERRRWQFQVRAAERGYHQVGPATIKSADILGVFPRTLADPVEQHLVVYPRVFPLEDLGFPADRPFGDRRGRNRLFEDPLRISGLREYRPGDPLKRIDWNATARRGDLTSRVYEPPATEQLYIVLNIDTLEHAWEGYLKEDLEHTVSTAASIAVWAAGAKFSVGLLANGSFPNADRPIRLPPSRSRDQLTLILEALAVIQPLTMGDLAGTVAREGSRIPAGSTIVAVASLVQEPLAAILVRLQAEGHRVFVVATSGRVQPALPAQLPLRLVLEHRFAARAGVP